MGQPKKKGQSGAATNYVSRAQALKRLQLSLKDFRRLCILKGIYPHEPKRKKVAGRGNSALKTYYYLKDIQFIAHEPIIKTFRKFKVFMRKIKKAQSRKDGAEVGRLYANRPSYRLDHIVKERYPTFLDALRDLDDSLSMCMLFSTLPKSHVVPSKTPRICRQMVIQFLNYVIESRSLRKVFISIKGYYYQAEIQGQLITWIVPHQFAYKHPDSVDFKIMLTFVEFYSTMLGFVNFKLYNQLNLHYPPTTTSTAYLANSKDYTLDEDLTSEKIEALNQTLSRVVSHNVVEEAEMDEFPEIDDPEKLQQMKDEQTRVKKLQKLFEGLKFYLNREVPREQFVFVIRCFGGDVSWDKTIHFGATYDEDDPCVTHHVIDRPMTPSKIVNKYYVQPQYIFDCVNNCALLPVEKYFPGVTLPPHLSPFVEESEGDYVPPDKLTLLQRPSDADTGLASDEEGEEESEEEEEQPVAPEGVSKRKADESLKKSQPVNKFARMEVQPGKLAEVNRQKKEADEAAEEKRLAVISIPKKKRRLYNKIMYGKKQKVREVNKLKEKREKYELEQKSAKKKKAN